MKGKNHEHTKRSNLSVVFEIIRQHPRVSRVSVAQQSGLRNQTITNLVRELIQTGYVLEVGKVQGKRGQPQTLLEVNPASCLSIGLQIEQGFVNASLVDLNLNLLADYQAELTSLEPDYVISQLDRVVNRLLDMVPNSRQLLIGVGVLLRPCSKMTRSTTQLLMLGKRGASWI